MFTCLSLLAIFLCVLHLLLNYNEKARMVKKIPGPKDDFIFGNGLVVIRSPVELFKLGRTFAETFNGIYRIWVYPFAIVNIYNPSDIEKVISTTKYNDKGSTYRFLQPWLQDGLLLSKGTKWQQRRKILTPAFHFNILRQFCVIMEENSKRLVETLRKSQGASVDVIPVTSEYTLSSICETAMGSQLHEEANNEGKIYKESVHQIGMCFVERFARVYLFSDFLFNLTSLAREQTKNLHVLHNFTKKVIEERKNNVEKFGIRDFEEGGVSVDDDTFMSGKKKKVAMLDLLISAEKEGLIDRVGIQEEVDTFMFEGHDTTASGLTYCLMLLANHKYVQEKIVAELNEIFEDSDRAASIEDLSMMRYLERCIKESLRIYPPVHFISRHLKEPIVLSGYKIPAGSECNIHIYDLHRRADLFPNPMMFDPDRFLPENSLGRHPYAYIPFSAGPRNCIGQKFAIMEMKSCVSNILRNFELLPVTKDSDLKFQSDLVLRNSAPVYVKFVARNNKEKSA